MSYAIRLDWYDELRNYPDKWTNHGRNVLEASCKHKQGVIYNGYCEKCEISEDDCEPMMNFIYPLELADHEESKILEVVKRTCCTVMENTETGEFFLTLCGGGMDLSQDIGLAYHILETRIPLKLCENISLQYGLSKSGKDYIRLVKQIKEELTFARDRHNRIIEEIDIELKKLNEKGVKDE